MNFWIIIVAGLVAEKRCAVVYVPGAKNFYNFLAGNLFVKGVNVEFAEGDGVDSVRAPDCFHHKGLCQGEQELGKRDDQNGNQ